MSKIHILGESLPHMPWQDRPQGTAAPVWRHSDNPVIGRNPLPGIARIFNSAVAPYGDRFAGIFRGETVNGRPYLYLGFSEDGLNWDIDPEMIRFVDEVGRPFQPAYSYDPRLIKIED